MGPKRTNMCEKGLNRGPRRDAGGLCCSSPVLPAYEAHQALQILHRGAQYALIIEPLQASPSRPPKAMLVLALGEQMLASDAGLSTDRVASGLVDLKHPIACLSLQDLLHPGSAPVQVEGFSLPDRGTT